MKTTKLVIIILFLFLQNLQAQDMPGSSQYLFSGFLLNPAVAGTNECKELRITDRHQWLGVPLAPNTQTISYHMRYDPDGKQISYHGFGIIVGNDVNGPLKKFGAELAYAYHTTLIENRNKAKNMHLSFGLSVSGANFILDESIFEPAMSSDPILTGAKEVAKVFNANVGVFLYSHNLYAGIAGRQLIPSNISFYGNEEKTQPMHLFLYAGYRNITTYGIGVEPSFAFKMEPSKMQLDVNFKTHFYAILWVGASARFVNNGEFKGNSILPMFGFNFEGFNFGYAFDYSLNGISGTHNGTHEIMLGYDICPDRTVRGHRSVPCPAY